MHVRCNFEIERQLRSAKEHTAGLESWPHTRAHRMNAPPLSRLQVAYGSVLYRERSRILIHIAPCVLAGKLIMRLCRPIAMWAAVGCSGAVAQWKADASL